MAKSTYYYHMDKASVSPKKEKEEKRGVLVKNIFFDNNEIYGYRRIRAALEKGWPASLMAIRRLMKALGLNVKGKRIRSCSSWRGDTAPAPENLVQRNFHAEKPNMLWLTDITEFPHPDGKVYLSLLMDCRAAL